MTRTLLIILVVLMCVGCRSTAPQTDAPLYSGTIWVTYRPYLDGALLARAKVRPVPFYTSWTDSRMVRELRQLSSVGISGVLVTLTPEDLLSSSVRERFRRFSELSAGYNIGVAPYIVNNKAINLRRSNLINYLHTSGILKSKGTLHRNGYPVAVVGAGLNLGDAPDGLQEGVTILRVGRELPPCPGSINGISWIMAANNGGCLDSSKSLQREYWTQPRIRGASLRQGLIQAASNGSDLVILSSWNDYANGSYIEPNSLDKDLMLNLLRSRLQR